VTYILGIMARRVRTTVTVDDAPRSRKRKKNNNAIIVLVLLILLGLFLASRTRQVAGPQRQPVLVHH